MIFLFRVILVLIFLLGLQYLFIRLTSKAFKSTFPRLNISVFRTVRLILVIFLNLYPLCLIIYTIVYNGQTFPESDFIDYFLIYPFWQFVLIFAQTLMFILAVKIVKFIVYWWYKRKRDYYYRIEQRIIFLLFILSVVYVPLRTIHDYYTVEIRDVVYKKKNLPEALKNFKLVFISDTQADRYTNFKRLGNYINLVNKQKPDLVLIGGDVITSTPNYIDSAAYFLGKIKSKYGVYTCLGDHDHWAYRDSISRSIAEVTAALAKKGVPMINDKNMDINVNGADISITFITNTYVERTPHSVLDKLIIKEPRDFKILLTHQTGRDLINLSSARNYELLLAGHTHGGQITFLFPFINLTPTMFETQYIKGDFWFGHMLMIITRGLGMSLVPFRLNSTPEITVIHLTAGE